MNLKGHPHSPQRNDPPSKAAERVGHAKVAVGRGWEAVRNMNWREFSKKEAESNGSRIWGRLVEATEFAKQKFHDIRDGGNESDDDTPESTHTQRVLFEYYVSTKGSPPAWLPPPPNFSKPASVPPVHPSTRSHTSSGPGPSVSRPGGKAGFLQDIYDSTPTSPSNPASRQGRNPEPSGTRGDQLKSKLWPSSRVSPRNADRESDSSPFDQEPGFSSRSGDDYGDNYPPRRPGGYDGPGTRPHRLGGLPRGRPDNYNRR